VHESVGQEVEALVRAAAGRRGAVPVDPERHTAAVLRLAGDGYLESTTAVGTLLVDEPLRVRVPL
jgi:hypothetical protein